MSFSRNEIMKDVADSWAVHFAALGKALNKLEKDLEEATDMAGVCTREWCQATEHVINELGNALFTISEPRWFDADQSRELKRLKRKLHDLYANYRTIYKKVA